MMYLKNTALVIALFITGSAETRSTTSTIATTTKSTIQPAPTTPIVPILQPQPQPVNNLDQTPKKRTNEWRSSAGLVYKSNKNFPNRINHVLEHAKVNPLKPTHSVFSVPEYEILDLIDEAWNKRGNPEANLPADTYIINMGRPIGTKEQSKIKIVVTAGTSDIVTAFPA